MKNLISYLFSRQFSAAPLLVPFMPVPSYRACVVSFRRFNTMLRCFSSPNILVYSEDKQRFNEIKSHLDRILEPHSYVIYPMGTDTLNKSKSWQSTTRVLILASDWKDSSKSVQNFLSSGGLCLSICPVESTDGLAKTEENDITVYKKDKGFLILCNKSSSQDLAQLLQRYFNLNVAVKSASEKQQPSSYSGYIVAEPFQEEAFFRLVKAEYSDSAMTYKLHLPFLKNESEGSIFIRRHKYGNLFNHQDYFTKLSTKSLGRTCVYFDTLNSTQALCEGCPSLPNGIVVVAKHQTVGRGRSGNVWLSPEGCAMFSFRTQFPLQCEMGRHLSLLQHIAALAIVTAVKDINKDIAVGVKWPNDIYYQCQSEKATSSFEKLGGVLATSSIAGHEVTASIGIGFNLNNKRPTVCLNELLVEAGSKAISLECFIASVLNQAETLIDSVNTCRIQQVLDLYHDHWLHAKSEISVRKEEDLIPSQVVGIDDYGFLRVKLKTTGEIVTVHPDGNSFDMLNGLLVPKLER